METALSPGLRRLLETKLDTLEKLELVLALCVALDYTSTIDVLARELQIGPGVLGRLAAVVASTGLVEITDSRVRLLVDADDRAVLAEAAQLYENDRSTITQALTAIAMSQIRQMAARTFADAFQLRTKKKPKKGDGDG